MHKSVFLNNLEDELGLAELSGFSLSSIFISAESINSQVISKLRSTFPGTEIYSSMKVFEGEFLADEFKDALSVDFTGKSTQKGNYFGLCPTHPELIKNRLDAFRALFELNIDGIWLDEIKYPTIWDLPEPDIMDTCYCDRCLTLFSEFIGEPLEAPNLEETQLLIDGCYYHEWLQFKSTQITGFVQNCREIISSGSKKMKLGMFVVPWEDKEFGSGIKRIIAQDFGQLVDLVDVISPMLYRASCDQSDTWISEKIEYFWSLGKGFLPVVSPLEMTIDNLEQATVSPSIGVVVRAFDDVRMDNTGRQTLQAFFARK